MKRDHLSRAELIREHDKQGATTANALKKELAELRSNFASYLWLISEPIEPVVETYKGRIITRGVSVGGMEMLHFYEGKAHYGIEVIDGLEQLVLATLKEGIDYREEHVCTTST